MPFVCHSSTRSSAAAVGAGVADAPRLYRPPGMTILPALRFAAADAARGFGRPSRLRWRAVSGFSSRSLRDGGGGVASGEEMDESELMEDGEPGAESVSGGVSMSPSSRLSGERMSAGKASCEREALLCRFAIDCELSEDADDSSNVRFGER